MKLKFQNFIRNSKNGNKTTNKNSNPNNLPLYTYFRISNCKIKTLNFCPNATK